MPASAAISQKDLSPSSRSLYPKSIAGGCEPILESRDNVRERAGNDAVLYVTSAILPKYKG